MYILYGNYIYCATIRSALPRVRKKLKMKQWLTPRKNLLRQEVFFLWAARSNWGYLENVAVSIYMCCSLVWLYFLKWLHGVSEINVSCRLRQAFICLCIPRWLDLSVALPLGFSDTGDMTVLLTLVGEAVPARFWRDTSLDTSLDTSAVLGRLLSASVGGSELTLWTPSSVAGLSKRGQGHWLWSLPPRPGGSGR